MAAAYSHTCEYCEKLNLRFDEPNGQYPSETSEYLFETFTALDAIAAAGHGCPLCSWILYPNSPVWLHNERPEDYKLYYEYIPATEGHNVEIREFGFKKATNDAPNWRRAGRFVVYAKFAVIENPTPKAIPPEKSIQLAKEWLEQCRKGEEKDARDKDSVYTGSMPRRLIQIDADGGNLRLKSSVGQKVSEPYAALSYSWGGNQPFKTTNTNELERQEDIALNHLPKTIRDAVKVTSGLGIRFLWVDSQCILQDRVDDQRDEFLEQARIYSGAEITIAASKSWNHREGFLDEVVFKLPSETGGWFLLWKQNPPEEPEPLSTRGWAFQEYLLSRRILFYESYKLRFVSGSFEMETHWYDNIRPSIRQPDYNSRPGDGNRLAQLADNHAVVEQWYRCVENFSQRQLTKPVDKIPAMIGLAIRYMTALNRLPFASGIWLRTSTTKRPEGEVLPDGLAAGLLWKKESPSSWKLRKPAWSWASSDGPVDVSSIIEYLGEEPDIEVTHFGEYRSRLNNFKVHERILGQLFARTVGETVKLTGHIHLAMLKRQNKESVFDTIEVTVGNGKLADLPGPLLYLDVNLGLDSGVPGISPGNAWGPIKAELLSSKGLAPNLELTVTLLRLYPRSQNTSLTSIIGLILLCKESISYIRLGVFEFSLPKDSDGHDQEQRRGDLELLNREFNQSQRVSIELL